LVEAICARSRISICNDRATIAIPVRVGDPPLDLGRIKGLRQLGKQSFDLWVGLYFFGRHRFVSLNAERRSEERLRSRNKIHSKGDLRGFRRVQISNFCVVNKVLRI
jgi:hypothetical protein